MLNRPASLAMSTNVLKGLPGKLDIKRHSPSILYLPIFVYPASVVFGNRPPSDVVLLDESDSFRNEVSRDMCFPTMWHFDKCRLKGACAAFCALWSPAGKGLTSWLSFVVSNCEFVTFPLVSWVRCDT